jgi:Flp pilus assembly protein TadG
MRSKERGQTLAEFALVIPIFLLILMGIFDMGRAVFAYSSITNAAREGTRLGIVNQNTGKITERANQMAAAADKAAAAVTIQISQSGSAPTANDCAPVQIGCNVRVEYKTVFRAITPIVGALVGNITLKAESVEPVEYVCGVTGALIVDANACPKQP